MGLRNFIFNTTGICLKKVEAPFVYSEMIAKKNSLKKASKINILALGSSHGSYAFISSKVSENSFNLCSASQDLYYSYQLYKMVNKTHPELNKITLFYSVFSNGFELDKTNLKIICAYFEKLYGIKPKSNHNEINTLIRECKTYKKTKTIFNKADNGFLYHKNTLTDQLILNDRVNYHTRENLRSNDQLNYLVQLIADCNKNNQKLVIALSPARSDYKQRIPNNSFDKLFELKKHYNFEIIDFFNSNLLTDDDFFDCDHVNLNGAVKLTTYLKCYL